MTSQNWNYFFLQDASDVNLLKTPQPTQRLAQNSSQEGEFHQEDRGRWGNYFAEFININFVTVSFYLLYLSRWEENIAQH